MSNKGIYTALSGAIAQNEKLDTIANNIANVNTPAFKKDQQIFKEYLNAIEKNPEVIAVPKIPAAIESFYDLQGSDKSMVNVIGTYTDFSQGGIKATGNALDLAIEGDGFFEVLTDQGIRYTRNGSFRVNSQNQLVTKEGYPVLRRGVEPPIERTLKFSNANIVIAPSGEIINDGNNLGNISVQNFSDKDSLKKIGSSLYQLKPNMNTIIQPTDNIKIHQGYIETSNVNIIQEMTDMISTTRMFESTQKTIKAFDQINEKLINEVPKL